MMQSEFVFWSSLLMLVYIYLGYPVLIYCYSRIFVRPVKKSAIEPCVSVIIAAYNEEDVIGDTVENKFQQNYPADKLEVIVVSDGSTDGTDQLVLNLCEKYPGRLRLLRQEPRAGKTSALNMAIKKLRGEILVFADANSMYANDAVRMLVRNFADPSVGYVTGKMVYVTDGESGAGEGCSSYMRYENFLREQETGIGSVVGVDGGIDAVRKELFSPMRADQLPDFVLPLKVVAGCHRVVYEPDAILREPALQSGSSEYRMRVRVALRALWALWDMRDLLNPLSYGVFALQLLSHKVLRYLAFVFLLAMAISNFILFGDSVGYRVIAIFHVLFYAMGATGLMLAKSETAGAGRIFYIPYYFLLLNFASAQAFIKFILRRKQILWKPRLG